MMSFTEVLNKKGARYCYTLKANYKLNQIAAGAYEGGRIDWGTLM